MRGAVHGARHARCLSNSTSGRSLSVCAKLLPGNSTSRTCRPVNELVPLHAQPAPVGARRGSHRSLRLGRPRRLPQHEPGASKGHALLAQTPFDSRGDVDIRYFDQRRLCPSRGARAAARFRRRRRKSARLPIYPSKREELDPTPWRCACAGYSPSERLQRNNWRAVS